MSSSLARLAPLSGFAFVVLLVASFFVADPPASDGATEEVVSYWVDNETANIVAALLGGLTAVAAVWFGGSVRAALLGAEGEPGRLAAVAFAGFLAIGLGVAMWSGFQFAAADTAGDVPAETTQALAVLVEWFFLPFAVGIFLAFLASGIAILRHGGLPRWLGFLALPIPLFFFTPIWFIGMIGAAVWLLAASWLLLRAPAVGSGTGGAPPAEPAHGPG